MESCLHCSQEFSPCRAIQIYCSKSCRERAQKKRDRDRVREQKRIERELRTGLKGNQKKCVECDAVFQFKYNGEKYCGEDCRQAGAVRSEKARLERARLEKEALGPVLKACDCVQCGRRFFSEYKKKICSDTCRNERQKSTYMHKTHGITSGQYEKMLIEQEAKCLICKKIKRLVIDHCHNDGHIRGLLCSNCNSGLGYFADSVENFENAILYLRERGHREGAPVDNERPRGPVRAKSADTANLPKNPW